MMRPTYFSCAILLLWLFMNRAEAHPHVWVTFHSEVLYAADGTMTGVRHAWTFDDMFSALRFKASPTPKRASTPGGTGPARPDQRGITEGV